MMNFTPSRKGEPIHHFIIYHASLIINFKSSNHENSPLNNPFPYILPALRAKPRSRQPAGGAYGFCRFRPVFPKWATGSKQK